MRTTPEQDAALMKQAEQEIKAADEEIMKARRRYRWTGLTKDEHEFLMAKGVAFRELWIKKHTKGMTLVEKRRFTEQVIEFHKTEEP